MITFSELGVYGGLGNQLYQYAFVRAVARKNDYELRIPARCFAWTGSDPLPRENALSGFRLECEPLTGAESFPNRYYAPGPVPYDPALLDSADGTDFRGYFQERLFFEWCADDIRREFRFRPEIERRADDFLNDARRQAHGRPLVSISVRRGDYLALPHLFRVLTAAEIRSARAEFGEALFVVGSDDLAWCRDHVTGEDVRYAPEDCAWTQLAIASRCDHNIIAASTFAWWAAWLNPSPRKRVLYPDPWHADPKLRENSPAWRRHPPEWEPLPTDARPAARRRLDET